MSDAPVSYGQHSPCFSREEQDYLLMLCTTTAVGRRLLELMQHGWGDLHIIVTDHTILKTHMTKTDK